MQINYLLEEEIIKIHFEIMEKDEDIAVLHQNLLESTLDRIQWTFYNKDEGFFDKCAILFRDIVSGHIFVDGNKRTGFASLHRFLRKNGFEIKTYMEDQTQTQSILGKIKQKILNFFESFLSGHSESHFSYIWEFVLKVASEEVPLTEIKDWIIRISEKIK